MVASAFAASVSRDRWLAGESDIPATAAVVIFQVGRTLPLTRVRLAKRLAEWGYDP
jgi:hypothetical protein